MRKSRTATYSKRKRDEVTMLKVKEVAELYKVSESTIYKWMREGMPNHKIGRVTRFDEKEVSEWVRSKSN